MNRLANDADGRRAKLGRDGNARDNIRPRGAGSPYRARSDHDAGICDRVVTGAEPSGIHSIKSLLGRRSLDVESSGPWIVAASVSTI